MVKYELQIMESVIVVLAFFVLRYLIYMAINRATVRFEYQQPRMKMVKKVINIILTLIAVIFLIIIYGVDQSELFLFLSSFLTVVGIGFFAQWSILSNISATVILFFSHKIKIGDEIMLHEKDSLVAGRVSDIGAFFIVIVTLENEQIIIPSNLVMQKAFKKKL